MHTATPFQKLRLSLSNQRYKWKEKIDLINSKKIKLNIINNINTPISSINNTAKYAKYVNLVSSNRIKTKMKSLISLIDLRTAHQLIIMMMKL